MVKYNEGVRADVTTVATNSFLAAIKLFYIILNRLIAESVGVELQFLLAAIKLFYIILNRLIAESVGVELQFLLQSGNSNYICVITPP